MFFFFFPVEELDVGEGGRQGNLILGWRVQGEEKNMRSLYCFEGHHGNFCVKRKGNWKGPPFQEPPQLYFYATPKLGVKVGFPNGFYSWQNLFIVKASTSDT